MCLAAEADAPQISTLPVRPARGRPAAAARNLSFEGGVVSAAYWGTAMEMTLSLSAAGFALAYAAAMILYVRMAR